MKRLIIPALTLFCTLKLMAFESPYEPQIRVGEQSEIEQYTTHWLQYGPTETFGSLRGDPPTIGGEDPGDYPIVPNPIGGGMTCLLILAGGYLFLNNRKKKILK